MIDWEQVRRDVAEWVDGCQHDWHYNYYTRASCSKCHDMRYNPYDTYPDYPNDLDALFEWAVPKLDGCHIDYIKERRLSKTKEYFATAWIKGRQHACYDDKDPARALCLAIWKVIKEVKDV